MFTQSFSEQLGLHDKIYFPKMYRLTFVQEAEYDIGVPQKRSNQQSLFTMIVNFLFFDSNSFTLLSSSKGLNDGSL